MKNNILFIKYRMSIVDIVNEDYKLLMSGGDKRGSKRRLIIDIIEKLKNIPKNILTEEIKKNKIYKGIEQNNNNTELITLGEEKDFKELLQKLTEIENNNINDILKSRLQEIQKKSEKKNEILQSTRTKLNEETNSRETCQSSLLILQETHDNLKNEMTDINLKLKELETQKTTIQEQLKNAEKTNTIFQSSQAEFQKTQEIDSLKLNAELEQTKAKLQELEQQKNAIIDDHKNYLVSLKKPIQEIIKTLKDNNK
tara:strand:+ start:1082 stop:1846 length:765 start_codon:yes stop_codon:yes gene_type:complete